MEQTQPIQPTPEPKSNTEHNLIWLVGVLFMVIFLLIMILIFRKPKVVEKVIDNTKATRDSIVMMINVINKERAYSARSVQISDSIINSLSKTQHQYDKQKSKVPSATLRQLDSITRANAGLPPR